MKIEMGKSLIYSWLRHEKQCQVAQTNWKPSPYGSPDNFDELQTLFEEFNVYYKDLKDSMRRYLMYRQYGYRY